MRINVSGDATICRAAQFSNLQAEILHQLGVQKCQRSKQDGALA